MVEVDTAYPEERVTCVLNQKGGVGKTALTAGAAGALARRGRRVLVIDLDPQGHLTTEALGLLSAEDQAAADQRSAAEQASEVGEDEDFALEIDGPAETPTLAALLERRNVAYMSGKTIRDLVVSHRPDSTAPGKIDVVPTSTEMFLVVRNIYQGRGRRPEFRLQELLSSFGPDDYDHVLIDCPPALDILTDNALVAAKNVLIPVELARTSLRALALLLAQIEVAEEELEMEPRNILGLVPSLIRRPLSGYAKYVADKFAEVQTERVPEPLPFLAYLSKSVQVEEAWLQGRTIVDCAPEGPHAAALNRIAVRLDVAAGLASPDEWDSLPDLPPLSPAAVSSTT